jgi:hypothetical protein
MCLYSPVFGLLLPLSLVGPVWIYCRSANPARTPRTEPDLLWFAVGVALVGGISNLLPFSLYRGWSRSRRAIASAVAPDLADPRVMGSIGAGVALFGATAVLHAAVLLDVFVSQPSTMSRYAIGNLAIVILEFGMTLLGYLVTWGAGALVVATRRWQRRKKWRGRRDTASAD